MKKMRIHGIWVAVALGAFSQGAWAQDASIDDTRAQAYIALGDELFASAQDVSDQLVSELAVNHVVFQPGSGTFSLTDTENGLLIQYNQLLGDASDAYLKVFGSDFGFTGYPALNLPANDNFFKREAYTKWFMMNQNFQFDGTRKKGAELYAVNADFKKDLLEKTANIIAEEQALDTEQRRLQQAYQDFGVSRVTADGELLGVQESQLYAQNYSIDAQTQVVQLQGQIGSLDNQQNFEVDDITHKEQLVIDERSALRASFASVGGVHDGGGIVGTLQVAASAEAPVNLPGDFAPGTILFTSAVGRWVTKGTTTGGWTLPASMSGPAPLDTPTLGDPTQLANSSSSLQLPGLPDMVPIVLGGLQNGTLDSDANGIIFSSSEGISASNAHSSGTSVGGGFSFLASASASYSTSDSSSLGRSKGEGVSMGFKSGNSNLPEANIGALVAVFSGTGVSPTPVFVGNGGSITVPQSSDGTHVKVGFLANDVVGSHIQNTGNMQVLVSKSTQFSSYIPAFLAWYNKKCESPSAGAPATANCGFAGLLDNIAYSTNPASDADQALQDFELTYPANLQPVPQTFHQYMSDMVQSSMAQKVADRDVDLSLHQHELTTIAAMTARDTYELSQQRIANTQQLAVTIQSHIDNAEKKIALLALGSRFYEEELANVERLKDHVLTRLHRYMTRTVDSFNYLYLADYKVNGDPTTGFEGDFYKTIIDQLNDEVTHIDVQNDLLNPNRGFVTYDLTAQQMSDLTTKSETLVFLHPQDFFCQGFGVENQVRVQIDKIGFLLDIDPINEQLFFKNPNVRSMPIRVTHGSGNALFDLNGAPVEYYLPTQTKDIPAVSARVLTDFDSDYIQLGLSDTFTRASFRNTSYATSWDLKLLDTQNFALQYLNGIKLVIYFTSTEPTGGQVLHACQAPVGSSVSHGGWDHP